MNSSNSTSFHHSFLGTKKAVNLSGEFISDNYAEKFEDQQRKYVDPSSRFYKTLYRYDILPGQIGRRADRESETCKDLLLANSGLFCIENEIRLFAERYSAYNKCSRSESLLQEIIDITEQEIDGKKKVVESQKKKREEQLEQDKQELIERLEAMRRGSPRMNTTMILTAKSMRDPGLSAPKH